MFGPFYVGDIPRDSFRIRVIRDGAPVSLAGYTGGHALITGPPADLPPVSVPGGLSVNLDGDYLLLTWPTEESLFAVPGAYVIRLFLDTPASSEQVSELVFQVFDPTDVESWATAADVLSLTGVEVSLSLLLQAQGVIELRSGAEFRQALRARDLLTLRKAVAYQAAFMAQNEAVFARAGVQSISQEGLSATAVSGDREAFVLAPLARMALQRLSWQRGGDRTLRVSKDRPRGSLAALQDAWLRDEAGVTIWQPVGTRGRFDGYTTEWGVA